MQAVERDLHDDLRADVHGDALATRLDLLEPLRLPREHLVGHALERLAEHHEPAGLRIARAEVEVAEPALPPPVAPFGGEDHEVERVGTLDLDPAGAAAPGLVRRVERLHHHALVPARERVVEEAVGLLGVAR